MSGSPVYVDGRLIGAVSYSIGAFSKEPIAGITPIAEMKDATRLPRRAGTAGAARAAGHAEGLAAALARGLRAARAVRRRPADVQSIGLPAAAGAQIGAMLRPIATPLVMSGFEPATVDLIVGRVPRRRLHAGRRRRSAAGSADAADAGPLREGDAIGVSLVGGDLEMGATGTVTHIDGDRVYAFGHPFFNLGPTAVPDDARLRLHDAAQPDVVVQDLDAGRGHRDDAAGSRRRRSPARSARARARSR